ncbi:hypothetical protein [Geodermatophilus nigrescens]|uniref:DUF5642 domain-containing protein n=1 Tax=Geodermatophilus nigrescens TaxID=1070870 RepID=A0A1M5HUT9_9ACTN|nr:hypothetical protein [Geodermatophilus nigrescens]SHG19663.1 hypothetical protein SAMN05444351_1748 [Geodermatophilus nigrescens]
MGVSRSSSRRRVRAAGAALAAGALLTAGCAGVGARDPGPLAPAAATEEPTPSATPSATPSPTPSETAPAPSPTPSPSPAEEPAGGGELRDRLLPAEAFGADATVVTVTTDQLGTAGGGWGGWGGWGGGWYGGWYGPWHDDDSDTDGDGDGDRWDEWSDAVTVEPPECAAALDALPALDGLEDSLSVAAQVARTPSTQTVEAIGESPALADLQLPLDRLLADCASVTTSGPWGWSATAEVAALDAPALGEQSAAVRVTVDAEGRDPRSVLVGVVLDGTRGLLLAQSAAPDAADPDPAAFTALLTDAAGAAFG